MSNELAIAATTAVLKSIMTNRVTATVSRLGLGIQLGTIGVSATAPDLVPIGTTEPSGLNLFMYQTTPNASWRNMELPTYDSSGNRVSNTPLAIDLHYLLTAYGKEPLAPDILLGIGMHILHENPLLTKAVIQRAFTPTGGGSLTPIEQSLAASGIAEQIDTIKITPHTLSSEEIFKLWSTFTIAYRPTAAYQISVILIQSSQAVKEALPVRQPKIYTLPFEQPLIESVEPQMLTFALNATVILRGLYLKKENSTVRFGSGGDQPPDPQASNDTELTVPLPQGVRAGVNTIQVIQQLMLGEPATLHEGFASNLAAFTLRPVFQPGSIQVSDIQGMGSNPRSAMIEVKVLPPVGEAQQVMLLLNEVNPPPDRPAHAYRFMAPSPDLSTTSPETDTLRILVQSVLAGTYLLRLRVDGAETLLELDSNNRPTAPLVQIP